MCMCLYVWECICKRDCMWHDTKSICAFVYCVHVWVCVVFVCVYTYSCKSVQHVFICKGVSVYMWVVYVCGLCMCVYVCAHTVLELYVCVLSLCVHLRQNERDRVCVWTYAFRICILVCVCACWCSMKCLHWF